MKRLSRIAALGCLAASLFNVRLLHAAECEYMIPYCEEDFRCRFACTGKAAWDVFYCPDTDRYYMVYAGCCWCA